MNDQPPAMAGWNLVLRFMLEIAALAGIAGGAWALTNGAWQWVAAVMAVLVAATVWGVFNVVGDPSRSGQAPVEVSGSQRLMLEAAVLGLGMVGLLVTVPWLGLVSACGIVVHYGVDWSRVVWLFSS